MLSDNFYQSCGELIFLENLYFSEMKMIGDNSVIFYK